LLDDANEIAKRSRRQEVLGVFPPLAVVSDPPQTRSSWSVSQDMKNRNDCMPERAFVLGERAGRFLCFLLLLLVFSGQTSTRAQSANHLTAKPPAKVPDTEPTDAARPAQLLAAPLGERATAETVASEARREEPPAEAGAAAASQSQFRVERLSLAGGAELLTIFGRADGLRASGRPEPEVPLISVVRDTLGDNDPENDRLRYVWMLTYTEPTLLKRIAAAIPFFYGHIGNQSHVSKRPPAPLIDLANADRQTWNNIFRLGLQDIVLDNFGIPLRASSRSYRRNSSDYHRAHVAQALSILSVYDRWRQRSRDEGELLASRQTPAGAESLVKTNLVVDDRESPLLRAPAFTTGEMLEIRARLILSGRTLGGLFGLANFPDTVAKQSRETIDISGHNWELLRQRAEAEGLYFEPLVMPDGSATHAMLWIAKGDREAQANRHFDGRFLNIADPWSDQRLSNWRGYSLRRYFDADGRPTNASDPQARPVEMVPLALYGLDHPRIPALLIDFRDGANPKRRELTRLILRDVTKNVLPLSTMGHVVFFLARTPYDWITGRRGMDVNQPSRLRSYSELKLLLAFNGSIDPALKKEIERRLEKVSVNPLANDSETEIRLARHQYDSLVDFARRPEGLPARIERDRRAEMVPLKHGPAARLFFSLGNVLTFGRYVHRETATPELSTRMELARRLQNHTRLLRDIAKSSPQIEVAWELTNVTRSLRFIVENGSGTDKQAAGAAARIFARTSDAEARRLCLDALARINNKTARNELLRLYRSEDAGSEWRAAIAESLRKAVAEDGRMKPAEAESLRNQTGQP
jgi:hypothetical protein